MESPALTIGSITKSFGSNSVLLGIDLALAPGEVTVLMGANGAGKSTLVKIICGVYQADGGSMSLAGQPYQPRNAAEAIADGVVTVHQNIDDGVIPDLDVANNLLLDRLTQRDAPLFVRERTMRKEAKQHADAMGITVPVTARVADLGIADRQMIGIARAMARAPKVLILDEPTSSLSSQESKRLFNLIDRLRDQGVAILYISHRMTDIRRVANRIIAMRNGKVAGVFEGDNIDYEAAVTAMLGHSLSDVTLPAVERGKPVLQISGMQLKPDWPAFDLTAHAGEVIAVTGLLGSGKSMLASAIFGTRKPHSANMSIDDTPYLPTHPQDAVERGVFMSPKDRGNNAVVGAFDIANNMTVPFLSAFSRFSLLSGRKQREAARRMIDDIGVVCQSDADGIGTLSGGNQQKVMIARWLLKECRVLLLDEPFQGVDLGARRDIGEYIRNTAQERATIIFVSEVDEALEVADRVIVMNEGDITGDHTNQQLDVSLLLSQITSSHAA